jgi:hypothetical protein
MNANICGIHPLATPPQASCIITQQYPILDAAALDKVESTIRVRISRNLRKDPEAFARKTNLPLRSVKRFPSGGLLLKLLTYGGIKLKIAPPAADGLSEVTVTFNPGKILYGHNGRIITYDEFLDAICIYLTHAKHLLEDPDDWIDLIPGLRVGGPGRWRLLELPTHCSDLYGFILAAFCHIYHPNIRTQARHWPTSIELGGKRAKLQFSIYQKAVEMLAHNKKLPARLLSQYADVLRLEVRLRGKKLVNYLGNDDTVEVIDGKKHLVRFFPEYITTGCRTAFSELENVWHSDEIQEFSARCQLAPLGSLIAHIASDPRCKQSFPDLLRHLAFYTRVGSKRDTIRTIRGAGAGEMSYRSTLSFDSLFGDAAYNTQPSIAIPEIERKVSHPLEDIRRDPLLIAAYTPPGWVSPRSDPFPPYCR